VDVLVLASDVEGLLDRHQREDQDEDDGTHRAHYREELPW